MKPLKALTISFAKPPTLIQTVSTFFLVKIYLTEATIAFFRFEQLDICDSYQFFPKTQKLFSVILRCPTAISITVFFLKVFTFYFLFII